MSLERISFEASEKVTGPSYSDLQVLNDARCLLNYRPSTPYGYSAPMTMEQKVERVFSCLGVEPFSEESVEDYKKKMIRWPNLKAKAMKLLTSALVVIPIMLLGASGAVELFLSMTIVPICNLFGWRAPHLFTMWQAWVFSVLAVGSVLFLASYLDGKVIKKYRWEKTNLDLYRDSVPLFALSRATEIKEMLPEANFYVDSLMSEEERLDPFLVMKVEDKYFYLDVWDEPKFEGRRVK